ncbi:Response regulator of zinc sigma-54-dependent two-component system [Olavius sp. associated proteobacterium Delta 1]|nr:Response regulator of zinc sigma-54-dependent two-component system [Olavius sp. associated proteobacterium Delta 1]
MKEFEILFVDDDRTILSLVEEYLTAFDYKINVVDSGLKALELIKKKEFDVVFTDFKMPDIDGLELLAVIKEYRPATEVIMVTGHGTMESAIQAMKFGSYDYIQKPFKLDVLRVLIDKIIEAKKFKQENIVLKTRLKERHRYDELVGISLKMREIYEQIDRMRQSSPNVLIQGESGTGKALTAHVIHRSSRRNDKPFKSVTCKSFGKGIAGDQLHDHAIGLFESAAGGAVFFDEIAEIIPSIQTQISRAFKAYSLNQAAADGNSGTGARILAATNRNLNQAARKDIFEPEFFNCINDVKIEIPPLKDRKEDICLLINHFLNRFSLKNESKVLNVSPDALDVLLRYDWPGNVIQLENVIERAFALRVDLTIDLDDLPSEIKTFGEITKSVKG